MNVKKTCELVLGGLATIATGIIAYCNIKERQAIEASIADRLRKRREIEALYTEFELADKQMREALMKNWNVLERNLEVKETEKMEENAEYNVMYDGMITKEDN